MLLRRHYHKENGNAGAARPKPAAEKSAEKRKNLQRKRKNR